MEDLYELMAKFEKVKGEVAFAHQRYAINYIVANPRRSVLVCYAMGTGKTFIAADVAVNHFDGKVVYMGPKSLHPVFLYHVKGIGGDPLEGLAGAPQGTKKYGTITSEASNVYEQLLKEVEPILGERGRGVGNPFDKRRPTEGENGEPMGEDPKVLLIMDECHLFSSRVAKILSMLNYSDDETKQLESEEKQAYKLYRLLCRDPRIRVVAMTGTPIKTHPFNLVPIANVVRREFTNVDGRRSLAFPEVYGRFYDSFVKDFIGVGTGFDASSLGTKTPGDDTEKVPPTSKGLSVINPTLGLPTSSSSSSSTAEQQVDKRLIVRGTAPYGLDARKLDTFSIRLRGLILWYEAPKGLSSVPFPVVESEEYIEIPMHRYQWKIYRKMEEEESRIEKGLRKDRPERQTGAPRLDDPSVYRSLTRQASNFAFPEDMYAGSHRTSEEMLAMMPDEAFSIEKIGEYSCKAEMILRSILGQSDRIHGVFSSFVKGAGLAIIERGLKVAGWLSLNDLLKGKALSFAEVMELARAGGPRREATETPKASTASASDSSPSKASKESKASKASSPSKASKETKTSSPLKASKASSVPHPLFVVLTGETSPEMRDRLVTTLNQPENTSSLLIRAVLYSGASAHGLTFKSGRAIHFLEPGWDDVEEAQARDRFIRINAAEFLPLEQRRIRIYYYIAIHPDRNEKEETTDQHLRSVAEGKGRLNGLFLTWLKCSAVNCEGMYAAENRLHSEMIAKGQVPPSRIFLHCVSCTAKYVQSYFLQELSDNKCTHTTPKLPMGKNRVELTIDLVEGLNPMEKARSHSIDLRTESGVRATSKTSKTAIDTDSQTQSQSQAHSAAGMGGPSWKDAIHVILDKSTGLGWAARAMEKKREDDAHRLIIDPVFLRSCWQRVLTNSPLH